MTVSDLVQIITAVCSGIGVILAGIAAVRAADAKVAAKEATVASVEAKVAAVDAKAGTAKLAIGLVDMQENVTKIEVATNSMKDALVKAAGDAARAEGIIAGEASQRERLETRTPPVVSPPETPTPPKP